MKDGFKEIGPLPEGETRDRVERLCKKLGYPVNKLVVVEGGGPDGKAIHKQNA
jgi:hypothetical protein